MIYLGLIFYFLKFADENFVVCFLVIMVYQHPSMTQSYYTVKILKIGTPEIITIIVLQLEQLDFTVQYCVQKMQTK